MRGPAVCQGLLDAGSERGYVVFVDALQGLCLFVSLVWVLDGESAKYQNSEFGIFRRVL